MNWFGKFMIFLAIAVVAVTCGMTVYYLAKVNEVITLEQSVVNTNKGEQFTVTVTREDAQADTKIEMIIGDANVLELSNTEKKNDGSVVFTFDAINGGSTTLTLNTSKEDYNYQNCTVYVGDGSVANPYFITSGEDMDKIGSANYALDANYKLANDIDLGMYKRWEPIANGSEFTGTFDGAGYTIYNLTIMDYQLDEYGRPATGFPEMDFDIDNAGLFAMLGETAMVKNLNMSNASVTTQSTHMGVVAGGNKGTIELVNVKDSVVGNISAVVGGVVGATDGRLSRVSFDGTINAGVWSGGIAAVNAGTIINAYAKGVMIPQTEASKMGGIVCYLLGSAMYTDTKAYVINTYSVMSVAQQEDETYLSDKMGMVVFGNSNPNGTNILNDLVGENRVYGNYYSTTQGFSGIYGLDDFNQKYFTMAVSLEQMKNAPTEESVAVAVNSQNAIVEVTDVVANIPYITYYGNSEPVSWDFEKVWMIDSNINGGLPVLRTINDNAQAVADMVYDIDPTAQIVITNEAQLRNMSANLNGNYLINNDITLTAPWKPLGTKENPFTGKVSVANNGERNYVINNVVVDEFCDHVGFFGVLGGEAQIVGLTLNNISMKNGWRSTGGIAAENYGLIQDCAVLGASEILVVSNGQIGGIAGDNYNQISNVKSTVNIILSTGTTVYSGGIVGWNDAKVNGAEFNGSIVLTDDYIGCIQYAGGIAGVTCGEIRDAFSKGSINLGNAEMHTKGAGIVSIINQNGKIINCGSAMDINAYNAGGIVGQVNVDDKNSVAISASYSTGKLSGTNVAGIVVEFKQGVVENVLTTAELLGSKMSGLVHQFDKNATIETSFVNVTFVGDGNKYLDTATDYLNSNADLGNKIGRFFRSWVQDDYNKVIMDKRCGGIMTNCIFNTSNGGELQKEKQGGLVKWFKGEALIKSTSKALTIEQCTDASHFTSKGFSTSVWNFGGDYPTLNLF